GKADVAATDSGPSLKILFGLGSIEIARKQVLSVGSVRDLMSADLNHDGFADLLSRDDFVGAWQWINAMSGAGAKPIRDDSTNTPREIDASNSPSSPALGVVGP